MVNLKVNLVPEGKYQLKCPNLMTPIGICVHNTANDASAANEIAYMVGNDLSTSFHIAVDDVEAVQGIPLGRNAWHAGDGSNGEGNRKYIAIEICYSKSGGERFDKAEENAAELIATMLKERSWGIDRVKKHQDFSGKYCPHRTLDLGWDRFINKIKQKMGASTMPNMYGTPNQYDLSNAESMKVAVDKLNEVLTGIYVKRTEMDAAVNEVKGQLQKEQDFSHALMLNFVAIANMLGLPGTANPDEIIKKLQEVLAAPAPTPTDPEVPAYTVPETIKINGKDWGLNGVNIVDGKPRSNYQRL